MSRAVFTPEGRERLREGLVSAAYADTNVIGAAVTGSAAVGREDQWSDIDLALCVAVEADLEVVCTARAFEHCAGPGVAGRAHDQRSA